ncbi:arylesterase [Parapedobacter sp. GCM10030251]|jgi:Lysophospholipase L1 and related esterases|uniref:arylesterase n=1 Tax=Parapedobacter sp. GCM10030251 TaxID=3273419 RepID=UPI003613EA6E
MLTRIIAVFGLFIAVACGSSTRSEDGNGRSAEAPPDTTSVPSATKNILFFGNSLTAGMGLESQTLAFPGIIQHWIDSLALPYRVINAGLSGETSAAGNERIDWLLNEKVDIFVLELGANDGLRGIPTEETKKNLQSIIDKVTAKYPDCKLVLAGMMVPPSMGGDYGKAFTAIFPALAQKNDMAYVPFLLEGVAGESTLNQSDGIHPTEEGHRILAETVWKVLKPLL